MGRAWKPKGRGWKTGVRDKSWYRREGGRLAICAVSSPKTIPAYDGGEWTEDELWVASVPLRDTDVWVYMMCDKPHRVTWALELPDCEVISRQPLPPELAARQGCYDSS